MGLDITPGGAHWAYSGFHHFRQRLAEAEGLDLEQMEGFGGEQRPWELPNGNPVTPLTPLLGHSDCDGYLDTWECQDVLPRLRQIVAGWSDDDYDKQQALYLIVGMEHCVAHGCAMSFH